MSKDWTLIGLVFLRLAQEHRDIGFRESNVGNKGEDDAADLNQELNQRSSKISNDLDIASLVLGRRISGSRRVEGTKFKWNAGAEGAQADCSSPPSSSPYALVLGYSTPILVCRHASPSLRGSNPDFATQGDFGILVPTQPYRLEEAGAYEVEVKGEPYDDHT